MSATTEIGHNEKTQRTEVTWCRNTNKVMFTILAAFKIGLIQKQASGPIVSVYNLVFFKVL